MSGRRQYAFWDIKQKSIPFICSGCGGRFLQLDHFERKKKFCSRSCVAQAQREGRFPLPDYRKNKPETQAKRYANLRLGPAALSAKLSEAEYIWRICQECREEFPAYCGETITNPAKFCSATCQHRNWQRRQQAILP